MLVWAWLVAAYAAYLGGLAAVWKLPPAKRHRVLAGCLGLLAAGLLAAAAPEALRNWIPPGCILAGYWLSGSFFIAPDERLEARLSAADRRLFGRLGLEARLARAPRLGLELLELAYALCYVVPILGWLAVPEGAPAASADRYWTIVAGSALASYGALPWLQTRPPRALEDTSRLDARDVFWRRINRRILDRGSIQVNTVPSGHSAAATGVALGLLASSPAWAAVFGAVALGIGAGSVAGRYHYSIDTASGILVAAAVWGVVRLAG